MFGSRLVPVALVSLLYSGAVSQAQGPTYSYRTFSVVDQFNLEQILNRNGAEGYRLVGLSASMRGNITTVMEKAPAAESYRYKVILGAWAHLRMVHNDTPIVDLLNEAGREGYRFVPNSVFPSKDVSAAVVVERAPGSEARYEYRVSSPQLPTTAKFERDFREAQKEGFNLVFYGTAGRGPSTLMEKQEQAGTSERIEAREYRRFECSPRDLVKRLHEETDKGYIPYAVSPWNDFTALKTSFWLQQSSRKDLRIVSFENRSGAEMVLLRGTYAGLAGELNKAASEGYSLTGLPIISRHLQGSFLNKYAWTLTAVMAKQRGITEYRVVAGESLPELNEQINAATREGFRVIPGSLMADTALLMERSGAESN